LPRNTRTQSRRALGAVIAAACATLGCGGGDSTAPPTDFTITAANSLTVQAGASASFRIDVAPLNGFSGSVQVSLQGGPTGLVVQPATPIVIAAGGSSEVAVTVPRQAEARTYEITLQAAGGGRSKSTHISLTVSPATDFSLLTTPAAVAMRRGDAVSVGIRITALNGFKESSRVSLLDLPSGLTAQPEGEVTVAAGETATFAVRAAAAAAIGSHTFRARAISSDGITHETSVPLVVAGPVRTFRAGAQLVLERVEGGDTIVVSVDTARGGRISAARLNGVDYLTSDGVVVGATANSTVWDCAGCGNGYSPMQGGDIYGHQGTVLDAELGTDFIRIRTMLPQWYPDNKNGGAATRILSDLVLEQWIYPVSDEQRAIRVRYQMNRLGSQDQPPAAQWLPAVHVPSQLDRFVRYAGASPWTRGALTTSTPTTATTPDRLLSAESWAALANAQNRGVTLYAPDGYRFVRLAAASGSATRMGTFTQLTLATGRVVESNADLILGDVNAARETIYRLRGAAAARSVSEPMTFIDTPAADARVSGTSRIHGWAIDDAGLMRVDVVIDGASIGQATYGQPRADLAQAFPGVTGTGGWQYDFNTRSLSDGYHDLSIKVVDSFGNSFVQSERRIIVDNGGLAADPIFDVAAGPPELVMSLKDVACGNSDLFDLPARAVRTPDGNVALSIPHLDNFLNYGATLATVRHSCSIALASPNNPRPENYDNWYWIAAMYRQGDVVHALLHNEYHDPLAPECKNLGPNGACVYNSLSYAFSTDGAKTFRTPTPPSHVIAAPREKWDPTKPWKVVGYFVPSNIVQGPGDGYFYSLIWTVPDQYDATGYPCLMRTKSLSDPASWRAWDGSGFTVQMTGAYRGDPATRACAPVSRAQIGPMTQSLTYNTYLKQYMLVGEKGGPAGQCGFAYSLSRDLIHWTDAKVFYPINFPYCIGMPGGKANTAQYPSLLDPDAPDVNFEFVGRTAYVYYVYFRSDDNRDRHVMRVPVTFTIR
jgi:hypothetical protein